MKISQIANVRAACWGKTVRHAAGSCLLPADVCCCMPNPILVSMNYVFGGRKLNQMIAKKRLCGMASPSVGQSVRPYDFWAQFPSLIRPCLMRGLLFIFRLGGGSAWQLSFSWCEVNITLIIFFLHPSQVHNYPTPSFPVHPVYLSLMLTMSFQSPLLCGRDHSFFTFSPKKIIFSSFSIFFSFRMLHFSSVFGFFYHVSWISHYFLLLFILM